MPVQVTVGGRTDSRDPGPLRLDGILEAVADDPDGGRCVSVRIGGLSVFVTSRRMQYRLLSSYARLGIAVDAVDLVVVKLGYLEPELFDAAGDWLLALTPGGVDQDLARLPYQAVVRPVFPLDRDFAADLTVVTRCGLARGYAAGQEGRTVLSGARVVTPDGILEPGWVELSGARIVGVGDGRRPGTEVSGWLLPGYVDLHVHGGGGHDFTTSTATIEAGVAFHRAHGTTSTLVSLVTAPAEVLLEQLARVAELADAGQVLGAHLEGPFLAATRCGAQHPEHLRKPDLELLAALLKAGRGHVRAMTVAPELPGAIELIDALVAEGVVAAIGHTDTTYEQAATAFRRGATLVTHAFNAMRSPHHRDPGPVPAALEAGVPCELINDGVHVHAAAACLLTTGPLVLVTDAIDAAGAGDGAYRLGGRDVVVRNGQARLANDGALAGSTLTMDDAVRRAVAEVGMSIGAASAAASGAPAAVLGLDGRCGRIAAGLDADLVLLDDDLRVRRVMVRGVWV